MEQPITRQRIILPHSVIVRAPGLLPMLYTIRELAKDLGIPERTLRDWLDGGAPHIRDERQRTWVDGEEFGRWVETMRKPRKDARLSSHQAWCLRCKSPVDLLNPETRPIKGKLVHIRGTCPQCGGAINRGGRLD